MNCVKRKPIFAFSEKLLWFSEKLLLLLANICLQMLSFSWISANYWLVGVSVVRKKVKHDGANEETWPENQRTHYITVWTLETLNWFISQILQSFMWKMSKKSIHLLHASRIWNPIGISLPMGNYERKSNQKPIRSIHRPKFFKITLNQTIQNQKTTTKITCFLSCVCEPNDRIIVKLTPCPSNIA